MTTTKVTAPHISVGMVVRSKYLGDGKSFYTVDSREVRQGINSKNLVITVHDSDGQPVIRKIFDTPEWTFNMNSKFEVR